MAREESETRRVPSLSPSGREPSARRFNRHEEESYKKDKTYRRYASGVERALSLFDTNLQEWADYISFLARLLKALQVHPPEFRVVPQKHLVAKRLAQCMNPSLPSGVHQKSIEVYTFIFSLIGEDALALDLPVYLPGLSATLSFASLSARPAFLSLFETYILVLSFRSLRPALKALILCLLPGLDDENSEEFKHVFSLMNTLKQLSSKDTETKRKDEVGNAYFWQCFFLASITSPSKRQGALNYLSKSLPKLGTMSSDADASREAKKGSTESLPDDIEATISPEPGLLIRCFVSGLKDDQLLIQRGFLELLVTHLPLQSIVLQARVKSIDLDMLVSAAASVVVRREISLNKRLWTWLLGPQPSAGRGLDIESSASQDTGTTKIDTPGSVGQTYFRRFGLKSLVRALQNMLELESPTVPDAVRPYRIGLSIMDQWEIGSAVVPKIFLRLLQRLKAYRHERTPPEYREIVRSATMFFDGVPSGLIWSELLSQLVSGLGRDRDPLDRLSLVTFVIDSFNIHEEEMMTVHIPYVSLSMLIIIRGLLDDDTKKNDQQFVDVVSKSLDLVLRLLNMVPERAYLTETSINTTADGSSMSQAISDEDVIGLIKRFYVESIGDYEKAPFSGQKLGSLLATESISLLGLLLKGQQHESWTSASSKIAAVVLLKVPKQTSLELGELLDLINGSFSKPIQSNQLSFPGFLSVLSTLASLQHGHYLSEEQLSDMIEPVVLYVWSNLSPISPKFHVEAVKVLWQLQSMLPPHDRRIEAAISSLLVDSGTASLGTIQDAEAARKFSILWTHSLAPSGTIMDDLITPGAISRGILSPQAGSSFETREHGIILTRPLLLLLDSLQNKDSEIFVFVRSWLQTLSSLDRLLFIVISQLLSYNFLNPELEDVTQLENAKSRVIGEEADLEGLGYFLQIISNLLLWSPVGVSKILGRMNLSGVDNTSHIRLEQQDYEKELSLQIFITKLCLRVVNAQAPSGETEFASRLSKLQRTSLLILHRLLTGPENDPLADMALELQFVQNLMSSGTAMDPYVQISMLDACLAALRLVHEKRPNFITTKHTRTPSRDNINIRSGSISETGEKEAPIQLPPLQPALFVKCLQNGLTSSFSRPALSAWIGFLTQCLPLFSKSIYQLLIPLVECLCGQIGMAFGNLKIIYSDEKNSSSSSSDVEILALLDGLEQILGLSHGRLMRDQQKLPSMRNAEATPGFLSNMVSGVFTTETPQARSATANHRLTVILTFQDSVKMCYDIWSWGAQGSNDPTQDASSRATFAYTSLRLRNRARRILENLLTAETLECLETIISIWKHVDPFPEDTSERQRGVVFNLLNALEASRPRKSIPAIFNAVYSRTNPQMLDSMRKSSLTTDLTDTEIVSFLVEYTKTIDDDAMDEIWTDCLLFLKDVLANPFPHRQTLPRLLEFAAILGEKIDNTNFGEQKKMRRELGDLFLRVLTAMFTTKPFSPEALTEIDGSTDKTPTDSVKPGTADELLAVISRIIPSLPKILVENDRVLNSVTVLSSNIISPILRSKQFPQIASNVVLKLWYQLARLPNAQKLWKKDIGDAFNDAKLFGASVTLVKQNWLPLLRQWSLGDKEKMPELLARITPPTTAGIVFGVGASSARAEADHRTQLNLRRIATLILAADDDTFVVNLAAIEDKLVELLSATNTSSPSSATRAEVFMVMKALLLKISHIHLALFWPIINAELEAVVMSIFSENSDAYNNFCILQACKLLDALLALSPDDFQLHEWLFVTDTVDAMYHSHVPSVALADEAAIQLHSSVSTTEATLQSSATDKRSLLLGFAKTTNNKSEDIVGKVLRPFFSQLSIHKYESTYRLGPPDVEACFDSLLQDLFDESSIVS